MNAIEIYENANRKLNKSEITLGEYERMIDPLRNVIPIPEGATNGEMFLLANKNATIFKEEEKRVQVVLDITVDNHKPCAIFNKTWWNTKYKGVEE